MIDVTKKLFFGWWIVIFCLFPSALAGAAVWYGFTAYFDPLIKEFGWSYTAISLGASLRGVEMGLADIVIGFLIDRLGSRRIIFSGSLLVGFGFIMLSRINSLPAFYFWLITIFVGATGISNVVFFSLIARWFRKRLGLALGLVAAGVGAGGFLVPVVVYVVDTLGFRMAFVIFGISIAAAGSLTAFMVRNRPGDIGLGPYGEPLNKAENTMLSGRHASTASASDGDYTVREALNTFPFWVLSCLGLAAIFSSSMVATHVMPYLEYIGYTRYTASMIAMMFPIMSMVGRLVVGGASDFVNYRLILFLLLAAQITGVALFYNASLSYLLIPFVVFFGVSNGGIVVIRATVIRNFYGGTSIGALIGLCFGLSSLGSLTGPLLAGWIFDNTNSYSYAWILGGILLVSVVPLVVLMKRPHKTIRHQPELDIIKV